MSSFFLNDCHSMTLSLTILTALSLSAAWYHSGRQGFMRGGLSAALLSLTFTVPTLFMMWTGIGNFMSGPEFIAWFGTLFILGITAKGGNIFSKIEKPSYKDVYTFFASLIPALLLLICVMWCSVQISFSLISVFGQYDHAASYFFLMSFAQAFVLVFTFQLGNAMWPKSWGWLRCIVLQLLLSAALLAVFNFASQYWYRFESTQTKIYLKGFQDDRLVVALDHNRGLDHTDRSELRVQEADGAFTSPRAPHRKLLQSDGDLQIWQEISIDVDTKFILETPTGKLEFDGPYRIRLLPGLGGFMSHGDEGWRWEKDGISTIFEESLRFQSVAQGHLIFTQRLDRRRYQLLSISPTTLARTVICESDDGPGAFAARTMDERLVHAREGKLYQHTIKSGESQEILALPKDKADDFQWELSDSKSQLLVFTTYDEDSELKVIDLDSKHVHSFHYPKGSIVSEVEWLGEDIVAVQDCSDGIFLYSISNETWSKLEKSSTVAPILNPRGDKVYTQNGHHCIYAHDLQGNLLATISKEDILRD
jgi:hypothetical protein